jgi:HAD superfamily hydrolase (TIGR01509 family)
VLPGDSYLSSGDTRRGRIMSGAWRPRTSGAGILFDLDGVLVHSAEPARRSWLRWASEHGLPERAVLEASHGRRTIDTVRALAPQIDARAEAARLEAEQSEDADAVTAGAGAAGLLASLPPGSWAVVTSCTRKLALARLTAAGLPPAPGLVCAEDVAEGKPSPEGHLLGAARIGLPPDECIVFEDAVAGIEAGHAAGMSVVAVAGLRLPSELASADLVVNELTEVRVSQQSSGRLLISIGPPAGHR